ncbi:hypothetical protein [Rhodococcus sp. O3]|uniref:hypothetical protein n=1 Tax=Rhodococcus sp. O3 TaxID=3404919 RepID=UPI003B683975
MLRTSLISAALVGVAVFAPADVAVAAPVTPSPVAPAAGPLPYRATTISGPCYRDPVAILCLLSTASSMPLTGSANITANPGLPNGGVGE